MNDFMSELDMSMALTADQSKSKCNHGRFTMQAAVQSILIEIDAHMKQ